MSANQRRLVTLVGVLVLGMLAGLAYVHSTGRQTGDVAAPAAGATPEDVVKAYTEALTAHDCATAEELMTDEAKGSARSWCEDVESLTDVEIDEHSMERSKWSGHSPDEQVVRVPVAFNLDWRPFHSDVSMEEGATIWGYLLVRSSPDEPWRIFDQGAV